MHTDGLVVLAHGKMLVRNVQHARPVEGRLVLEGPLEADVMQEAGSEHLIPQHDSLLGRGCLALVPQPGHRISASEAALVAPEAPDPEERAPDQAGHSALTCLQLMSHRTD